MPYVGRLITLVTLMVGLCLQPLNAWGLSPTRFDDFDHYTLALTWHPGFCATEGEARPECRDQHAYPSLVLHGLWPSLPATLAAQGMTQRQWWQEGCFHFTAPERSGFCAASPPLSLDKQLTNELAHDMPGSTSCLERHEYAKHAVCFGVTANDYFATALALRDTLADSVFGDYLRIHTGAAIGRNELIDVFENVFGRGKGRALKLQCRRDGARSLLTEVQVGIKADALDTFPASASLATLGTGNCATTICLDAPGEGRPADRTRTARSKG
ncbi:ribonuclease T2 family protein [Phytohalomonas tamaricis]|uniref:ribonuclease T2 family protein n=1 Tax=Phytohalomonas tamaricis TaxID=2081032 RepID=UPI000D0B26EA|nr:ribonuclease I [Phytohalomonas tamaricis]